MILTPTRTFYCFSCLNHNESTDAPPPQTSVPTAYLFLPFPSEHICLQSPLQYTSVSNAPSVHLCLQCLYQHISASTAPQHTACNASLNTPLPPMPPRTPLPPMPPPAHLCLQCPPRNTSVYIPPQYTSAITVPPCTTLQPNNISSLSVQLQYSTSYC